MAGPECIVVVASGDRHEIGPLPPADMTIAADAGLELALALGLHVDLVVGDMDSVDPVVLAEASARGVRVDRHPPEKDATDLELALGHAVAEAPARIHVVVGAGGRVDHAAGNLAVLGSSRWRSAEISATVGPAVKPTTW